MYVATGREDAECELEGDTITRGTGHLHGKRARQRNAEKLRCRLHSSILCGYSADESQHKSYDMPKVIYGRVSEWCTGGKKHVIETIKII